MERIIRIGDKDIKFRSDGGIGRLYRMAFRSDIFKDFSTISEQLGSPPKKPGENASETENKVYQEALQKYNDDAFLKMDMTIIENLAWVMAKKADSNIPDIDEWLSGFDSIMDLYLSFEQIVSFFNESMETLVKPKNAMAAAGRS